MSEDLGCKSETFAELWESLHEKQYCGGISFTDSIRYICTRLGLPCDEARLQQVTEKRMMTKAACFEYMNPEIEPMLKTLRKRGYKLAILSNCSEEEVTVVRESPLAFLVDELILSHETGLCKPQPEIYRLAAQRLGVPCEDCFFIGDG